MLTAHGIKIVADVRRLPGSKRYPHFNAGALADSLGAHAIRYQHFPELGRRRKPRPDSRNTAWRNDAFRGYADHMESDEFQAGIERLNALAAATGPGVLMCAEAVWWRCHRGLVADFLQVRRVEVLHIFDEKKTAPHPFTAAATVMEGRLGYREGRDSDAGPEL